jgi:glycosyltransferase involved in cell wall biosynthesis
MLHSRGGCTMPGPKFSVVTPSLNQASFLEENIKSVLAQHYLPFEHLIIDGGSMDATADIVRRYPHLQWRSEPDRGQAHALNKGFALATGEIIGWLNADDYYLPGALRAVAPLFDDPGVMVVYGGGLEVDARGKFLREIIPRGISTDEFIKFWHWGYDYIQPAFFFRRAVFEKVGMLDETLRYTMDHEFFIRLGLQYPLTRITTQLAAFRLHSASKTGTTIDKFIPASVWELLKISRRYWGTPRQSSYYRYLGSFLAAIARSAIKNLLFLRGSKSRRFLTRSGTASNDSRIEQV